MTDTPDLIVSEDVTRRLYDALQNCKTLLFALTGADDEVANAAIGEAETAQHLARKDTEGGAS